MTTTTTTIAITTQQQRTSVASAGDMFFQLKLIKGLLLKLVVGIFSKPQLLCSKPKLLEICESFAVTSSAGGEQVWAS